MTFNKKQYLIFAHAVTPTACVFNLDLEKSVEVCYTYDGKQISHTGNSFIIFGYNGRDGVITDVNGLLYMRSRYYSPELRRFVNADVLHGNISNSSSLNRYAYVNGNPVSFVDPFGLEGEDGFWNKIKSWTGEHKVWSAVIGLAATAVFAPARFAEVTTIFSMAFAASSSLAASSGLAGGLIGGVANLFQGKPFLEGMLGGAASGMIFSLGTLASTLVLPANPTLSLLIEVGTINNTINSVYYSFISDEVSNIDESGPQSYYVINGNVDRWDRLDYAKQETKDFWYSPNAWNYYSEYSAHMYIWNCSGWALDKSVFLFTDAAISTEEAEVYDGVCDTRLKALPFTIFFGILGI